MPREAGDGMRATEITFLQDAESCSVEQSGIWQLTANLEGRGLLSPPIANFEKHHMRRCASS